MGSMIEDQEGNPISPESMVPNVETVSEANNEISTDGIFTVEEKRLFDKTMRYREKMLDELFKGDQPPVTTGEMRVAKEIMESIDNAQIGRAKARISLKQNEDTSQIKAMVAETLLAISKNRAEINRGESIPVIAEESLSDITVPETALIDGRIDLNTADFVIDHTGEDTDD